MKFINLFFAASIPNLKVILVTLVGSFIALDRVNILSEDGLKQLNQVAFYVFNPALLFAYLANTITLQSLVTLWFMPLNILITFIIGSVLGWMVIYLTKAPSHLRGLILGCCSAGNLGNMLLIIVPAVCKEKGSPFGNKDVCSKYGMVYASLSMAIGSFYMWSYVYNIMRIYSSKKIQEVEINDSICDEAQLPSNDCSMTEAGVDRSALPCNSSAEKAEQDPSIVKFKQKLKKIAQKINLKRLLTPSTIGVIAGFIVGVVGPFRRVMVGDSAPLHVIHDSASLLGDGAIPTLSLIMGGNLLKGLKGSRIRMSLVFGIIVVRYVLLPISGVLIIKAAIRFGLIHSDPLYEFVLLLQYALPPAINIGTIVQLFGTGEGECAVIMLWTYSLASVVLTLWCTLFMSMVS